MPSTYSTRLRLELQALGENANTWGIINNTNLGTLIEQAIAGVGAIALPDADYTLSTANGAADEARNAALVLSGALSAPRAVVVPAAQKLYVVRNATTGGHAVTVKTAAGTGPAIAAGWTAPVYCDGADVRQVAAQFDPVANAIGATAVGVVPLGGIIMWSGSVASIPAGWALCDGTGGTPDLRDRFVIGAGGARAPGATGGAASVTSGSAGAHDHTASTGGTALTTGQLPAHTHTGTTASAGAHTHNVQIPNNFGGGGNPTLEDGADTTSKSTYTTTSAGAHTHSFTTDATGSGQTHAHAIPSDGAHAHTVDTLPPFYALAFIQRVA